MICLAHDGALFSVLPLLNERPGENLELWKEAGWKERVRWGFLNELPRKGKPGRAKIVEGLWRDRKRVVLDNETGEFVDIK
jgi:hypothetical protein